MTTSPMTTTPSLAEIKKMKSARTKAKKTLKSYRRLTARYSPPDPRCHGSRPKLPPRSIEVLRSRIEKLVAYHFADIERSPLAWYDNLVNKYGTTLRQLESRTRRSRRSPCEALAEAGVWLIGASADSETLG